MKQFLPFCFITTKNMKITKIVGENGTLPKPCARGQCPAALISDTGEIFVQGYTLDPSDGAALTAPAGEGFVRMSRTTFEKIARQVLAS
jgi:hypothetical protein